MNGRFFTRTRIALLILPWLLLLQEAISPLLTCMLGAIPFLFTPPVQGRPTVLQSLVSRSLVLPPQVEVYFITTSTLTSGTLDEKRSYGRICTVDGPNLLRTRETEIAQAYDAIPKPMQDVTARPFAYCLGEIYV